MRTVVSDVRVGGTISGTTVTGVEAKVLAYNDYYPFHRVMPGRNSNSTEYRYGGVNGQEKEDEIKGNGNHYTAEYWEYDPRVVMRWNTDPVRKAWICPYAVFGNNPILFVDPNGDDWYISSSKGATDKPVWLPDDAEAIKKYGLEYSKQKTKTTTDESTR